MKISRSGYRIRLIREPGERRVKNESDLFYRLRNLLLSMGEDVIKKEMSKDGHMVSDGVYYVRSRNVDVPGAYAIYDANYAVRNAAEAFNAGEVELTLTSITNPPTPIYFMETQGVLDWRPKR